LKNGTPKGVCRDAALTVSQLLLACGFSKDQVVIKQFQTFYSGHQVTTIKTAEGEYTINWDELYKMPSSASPETNLPFTGLMYTTFDPETGKILEHKRTELGDALKLLAGGTPLDPVYTPQMIVAEAAYGGLAARIFQTQDEMGNDAKGVAIAHKEQSGTERSFTYLSYGVAYAANERIIPLRPDDEKKLNQDIIYFQTEYKEQREIPLFDSKNGKLSIAPRMGISVDINMARNKFNSKEKMSLDGLSEVNGGASVFYDTDPVKFHVGADVVTNIRRYVYNTDHEKNGVGVYLNRYSIHAGASWDKGRLVASANSNFIIAQTEKQRLFSIGVADKKTETSCEAIYSVYDRKHGSREDFIVTRCNNNFSVQRIGNVSLSTGARVSLNERKDVILNVGAKLNFR
jgi:hypothetical protein